MRARNLKPGFFKNEILAECDPLARILFQGLWCLADREGRLECRMKRIKAEILPYDNCDIMKLMEQLNGHGFITIYQYEDQMYLEIPTFTQHQNCHIKECASTIPAPYSHESCTVVAGPLSSFPLLNPSYPSHTPTIRAPGKKKVDMLKDFDNFWEAYPKKKSKGDAEKAWAKISPNEELSKQIIHKVCLLRESHDWTKEEGQYVPYPATWLNAKGWEDEYQPGNNGAKMGTKKTAGNWALLQEEIEKHKERYGEDA